MPYVRLPGGIVAHVKMARPRRRRCVAAGCATAAAFQCDYQLAPGKTCDAWCCRAHATSVGPDIDHCPAHAKRQEGLFSSLCST